MYGLALSMASVYDLELLCFVCESALVSPLPGVVEKLRSLLQDNGHLGGRGALSCRAMEAHIVTLCIGGACTAIEPRQHYRLDAKLGEVLQEAPRTHLQIRDYRTILRLY